MRTKRTVLITGGTRGIGYSLVEAFAAKGYNIAFCYKNSEKKAQEILNELLGKEINALAVKCDVSNYAEVQKMYQALKSHFGFVDILINNAGSAHRNLFCDDTEKNFDDITANNYKSVFNTCSAFVPDMIKFSCGSIINISSIFGISGASLEVLYSGAKAAVIGFSRALAKELAPSGISVNVIAPGMIETDMNNNLSLLDKKQVLSQIPLGRFGKADEVASAAIMLAENSYITGDIIKISGGFN